MKHLCGVMAMVLSMLYAFPQSKLPASKSNTGVLSIGDTLPAIAIQVFDKGNIQSSNTASYKGKGLLLDFWATWCTACYKKFGLLDSLQKKYSNQLQIILVCAKNTGDNREKIDAFTKNITVDLPSFSLPVVIGDTIADHLFPHKIIPHYVWIDAHGVIKAITGSEPVTEENIARLLSNKSIKNLPTELPEVVVQTGYQSVPKERATGSFTQIDNKLFNQQTSTDVLSRLEAIASSVMVDRKTGVGMMIRGLSTLSGDKSPLIVLDQFPYEGDIGNINPNDVESITLLKDAAAASIWGARAGNGVIVITTKKSKFNQPISVELNTSISIITKPDLWYLKQINSSDYIDVERMLFSKGYKFSDTASINKLPFSPVYEILFQQRRNAISENEANARINALRQADVRNDFSKYFYRNAVNQQYAFNVKSGNSNSAWLVSGGYDKNISELYAPYSRASLRFNHTMTPVKNLQVSAGVYLAESRTGSGRPAYGSISMANSALPPYTSFADANGNPLPVAKSYRQSYLDTAGRGRLLDWNYYPLTDYSHTALTGSTQDVLVNLGIRYSFNNALSFDIKYQYEKEASANSVLSSEQSYSVRNYVNQFTQLGNTAANDIYRVPRGAMLDLSSSTMTVNNLRAQLNYSHTWGSSSLSVIAGSEVREAHITGNSGRSYGYNDNTLNTAQVDYATPYPTFITGYKAYIVDYTSYTDLLNRFVSVYTNGAYTYKNKYTVSVSGRKDASNVFGVTTNNRWTPLWSAGIAWQIDKERFYHAATWPFLRLRATYGYSGNVNQKIPALTTISYLSNSPYTATPSAVIKQYANPELRWEKVRTLNMGIDVRSKNNRVSGSVEFFIKQGIDLMGNTPIDYTTGIGSTITKNAASMKAHGIDIDCNSLNIDRTFKWVTQLNLSWYTDKITRYYLSSKRASNFINGSRPGISGLEGSPVYSFFSYQWAGLDPATGDPQGYYKGQVSKDYNTLMGNTIVINDLVYHGSAMPTFYGSMGNTFSWKNWSVTVRMMYKFGYYFRRNTISYNNLYASGIGHADFAKRWQYPGDEKITDIPSLIYPAISARDGFYQASAATISNASHIRLQYVTINYELDKQKIKQLPFKQIQLYCNASNLGILWSANKYDIDPDYSESATPPSISFTAGVRINY